MLGELSPDLMGVGATDGGQMVPLDGNAVDIQFNEYKCIMTR
jgi:hypothetical protein